MLHRLQEKKLISARWRSAENGRERKYLVGSEEEGQAANRFGLPPAIEKAHTGNMFLDVGGKMWYDFPR